MSDSESDLDNEEVAESLIGLELDNKCKITKILHMPLYSDCCHVDSVSYDDDKIIKCPRCEFVANIVNQEMAQNEAKKMKFADAHECSSEREFDVAYIQSNKNVHRLIALFPKK